MISRLRTGILLPFFLFTGAFAASQPRILPVDISAESDTGLSGIMSRVVNLELQRTGLAADPWIISGSPGPAQSDLLEKAEESGARFIFVQNHVKNGPHIETRFSFIESENGETIFQSRRIFTYDLGIDTRIAAEIRELLEDSRVRSAIEKALREQPVILDAARAPPPQASVPPAAENGEPARTIHFEPGLSIPIPSPGPVFDIQASPVFLFGDYGNIFPYGAAAALFGGYRLILFDQIIEAGIRLGAMQMFPGDLAIDGKVLNFLFAVEARWLALTYPELKLIPRAAIGPAVITARIPGREALMKTVLHGQAGVAVGIKTSLRTEIGMELGYIIMLEGSSPIMGFMPTLSFKFLP